MKNFAGFRGWSHELADHRFLQLACCAGAPQQPDIARTSKWSEQPLTLSTFPVAWYSHFHPCEKLFAFRSH